MSEGRASNEQAGGEIWIVGIGPGSPEMMTIKAREVIIHSEVLIGYDGYVSLVKALPCKQGQEVLSFPLTKEVERARTAVRMAREGRKVTVISSGDAGIYGMAGLVFEVLAAQNWSPAAGPKVTVVPGVSAVNACASLVGAPLMHDFVMISLSDLLTPWPLILKRLELAAIGDFVIVLYNSRSKRRTKQVQEAQELLLQHRDADTPVALVKNAYRSGEQVVLTSLQEMPLEKIDMLTTVIVGNSATRRYGDVLMTPRGYEEKYRL